METNNNQYETITKKQNVNNIPYMITYKALFIGGYLEHATEINREVIN